VDHSLGTKAVAIALREAGARVEILEDHFSEDTDDEIWIEVAQRGWVILTKDVAIRKRPLELAAALTSQHMTSAEMIEIFVKHLKRMTNICRSHSAPFWAKVTRSEVKIEKLK
jgi:uncharacterized protein with PIN domain